MSFQRPITLAYPAILVVIAVVVFVGRNLAVFFIGLGLAGGVLSGLAWSSWRGRRHRLSLPLVTIIGLIPPLLVVIIAPLWTKVLILATTTGSFDFGMLLGRRVFVR